MAEDAGKIKVEIDKLRQTTSYLVGGVERVCSCWPAAKTVNSNFCIAHWRSANDLGDKWVVLARFLTPLN
jgi:hypothetical protein